MKETGRISEINGREVTISGGEIASCFGCMNQECKSNKRIFTALNISGLDVHVGQLVEVENKPGNVFVQFLLAVTPPFLGFIAGYFLAGILFPAPGEGLRIAAGFLLLFLSAFLFYRVRKKSPLRGNPFITRILPEPEPDAEENGNSCGGQEIPHKNRSGSTD